MKYVLMHKEIPVAAIELDEVLCGIRKIEEIYNPVPLTERSLTNGGLTVLSPQAEAV